MADFIGTGFTALTDANDPRLGAGKDAYLGDRVVLLPSVTVLVKSGAGANAWTVITFGGGGAQTTADKNRTPAFTNPTPNSFNTTLAITATPSGYVQVLLGGVSQRIARTAGEKLTSACYFSGDGGATARAQGAIVAGDILYWNGVVSGTFLDANSRFDFFYEV